MLEAAACLRQTHVLNINIVVTYWRFISHYKAIIKALFTINIFYNCWVISQDFSLNILIIIARCFSGISNKTDQSRLCNGSRETLE